MTIDEGKLVALLVDKTGGSTGEVKENLHQLVEEITQAVESGRQFHVDNFGTFGMEDGTIYFEPASQLKTEINQKYAGMQPIELMAAFKETGAGIPVEEAPVQKEVEKTEPPAKEKEVKPKKKQKDQPKSKPVEKPPKRKKPKKKEAPPVIAKKEKPKPPKAPAKKKKQAAPKADKQQKDPIGTVLVAAVIIIAVLTGGWFLYNSGVIDGITTGAADRVPADTTGQQGIAQSSPPEEVAQDSTSSADSTEQSGINEVSKNDSLYGLKGSRNEQAAGAYTIVIHSFRLKSTVQDIADSLKQEGYRTVLFEGTANGESRWRLGLGQFKTINDAQTAVQTLTSPYKENHFIKRIPKLNP